MLWDLHGLVLEASWDDARIGERWQASFASRPPAPLAAWAALSFRLELVKEVPSAPANPPDFTQGDLLAYYVTGQKVVAHFPRYGQLRLDLAKGTTTGEITNAALATYGVFEDLIAIGFSPHLRRRQLYLIHAFAAAYVPASPAEDGMAILLVGDTGTGKTTTGLAFLHAGWKLLSNDSPMLAQRDEGVEALSYPGLLSAYLDSLLRFPELHRLVTTDELPPANVERRKILFPAEQFYPDVWVARAPVRAILFPQIEERSDHALERLPAPEALQLILPHAVERWDRDVIPAHLALLNRLIQSAPAFRLRLGRDTSTIPQAVAAALA